MGSGPMRELQHSCRELLRPPYADFARQVERLSTPTARQLAVIGGEAPAAQLAPGLVSRAVLFGLFAINPRLRVLFPELADDLNHESPDGSGPIRWPDQLALKISRTHPGFRDRGVISSGVWAMRVLNERVVHWTFGDIVWPPLTWSLVPNDNDSERDGLGPQITKSLPDVSEWVKYGPDRTTVDLRNLLRVLPAIAHPMLMRTNNWWSSCPTTHPTPTPSSCSVNAPSGERQQVAE